MTLIYERTRDRFLRAWEGSGLGRIRGPADLRDAFERIGRDQGLPANVRDAAREFQRSIEAERAAADRADPVRARSAFFAMTASQGRPSRKRATG